jgi:hypothetical protein
VRGWRRAWVLALAALFTAGVLTAWLASAGLGPDAAPYDYHRRVGMAGFSDSAECILVIGDSLLQPGDPLTLVCAPDVRDSASATIRAARVGTRAGTPKCCAGWSPEPGEFVYSVLGVGEIDQNPELCFALTAPPRTLAIVGGRAQADFDSDGVLERFHVCASFEGVHLNIWSGEPFRGALRWSRYFYVPYATDPTCGNIDSLQIRKWRGE